FLVLFSVSTVIHVWQSIKFRMWWALPTLVVSGTLEILGWSSRLWLSKSPLALTPYEIQLVGTILGPTPLVAATFVILGKIINTLGSQYSRLSSKLYTILFLSVDCVCLIIQGVGGAIAANAVSQGMDPGRGGNIMLGGIVTQMVCILFFVGCGVEFFVRVHSRTPVRILAAPTTLKRGGLSLRDINMKTMIATLGFMTMCFLVRAVYRTCELAQGWDGDIITTEVYFDVCDGGMIVLAMYALNIAHPGFLLR
ncbi:RTA-like protein, partial [Scleroderma citrinum]